jgi:hypothetical protein
MAIPKQSKLLEGCTRTFEYSLPLRLADIPELVQAARESGDFDMTGVVIRIRFDMVLKNGEPVWIEGATVRPEYYDMRDRTVAAERGA